MRINNSRSVSLITLFLFLVLISSDSISQLTTDESLGIKLMDDAEKLYIDGKYQEALDKLNRALSLVKIKRNLARLYLQLSVVYYALGQSSESEQYLRYLLQVEPEKQIDEERYPRGYLELYWSVIKDYPVVKAKPAAERKVKKGGRGFLLVIGALVVVGGGVAAALLLSKKESPTTGSIQVNSTPTDAQVFLDGTDTGLTTDCTLTDVSSGSHTVRLVKEGYENYEESVSITAGQTATVSTTLTPPTITVIEIPPGTVWTNGKEIEIQWETSGSGGVSTGAGLDPLIQHGRNVLDPFQRRAFQNRNSQEGDIRERGELDSSGSSEKFVILSGKQSKLQGVSKKLSSSSRASDIFNRRAKDIRDIRRMSRAGITSILVVPQISNGKFTPLGDIRVLALSYVKIDLYKGSTFNQTIVSSTENDGSYMWTVDSSLEDGTDYKVRISSTSDSSVYGDSETFTIEEKSITVTEPTSTTVWARSFPADITWTSNGTVNDVKIDLYKGDTLNQTIMSSTANDGSYTWTEVDTSLADDTDYKVRISSTDDSSVYGESETFRIADKSITVTAPTGSTVWSQGNSADITWTSNGVTNNVKIDLYKGSTLESTVVSSTEDDGTYTWTEVTPSLVDGSDYKVRISSIDDATVYGESGEFTIEGKSVTVTEPTGSTVWSQGNPVDITWISTGAISNIKIDLYKGITFEETIISSTENDGTYTWTEVTPSLVDGLDYKVWISDASESGIYDESDEFPIEGKSVTVTTPDSGTTWFPGFSASINWTTTGVISNVKIDLYKGITLEETVVSSTGNDGTYTWPEVNPFLADGLDYKVRISDASDSGVYSESETFPIENRSITVTEPTSSTVWFKGCSEEITWTSKGVISDVGIELYKGSTLEKTIVTSTENNGSYTWEGVDIFHEPGTDYKVRISDTSDSGVYDESDEFQITHSGYEFVLKWGSQGSGEGEFSNPMGVGVDSSGNVYVSDDGNDRVQKFTSTGTFLTQWGSYGTEDGEFDGPQGIGVDSSGNVYVADHGNQRIQKFTSDGTFLAKWGQETDVLMQFPRDLAVDSSGNVYVASSGFHNIMKFTSDGTFLLEWGSPGSGYNQFSYPVGIAVDGDGYVYVADTGNNRIQKFTSDGTFVAKWEIEGVIGLAVDSSSNVYVTANNVIQKFTSDGTFLTRWGRNGSGDGQFCYPWQIEVDSSGNVYVADACNHRVQKFQPVSSSSQQLNRSNSKILNTNFSVDKNSTQKSSTIKPSHQNRSKQSKQIKKKDKDNEKRK